MYAEAYLEPSWASMVELLCEDHEKVYCRCLTDF